jgi:hypothetical protein
MSFILDALKKIDSQRRAPGESPAASAIDLDALYGDRRRRRRHLASMAMIALLSAGATAAGLRWLSKSGEVPRQSPTEASAGTTAAADSPDTPVTQASRNSAPPPVKSSVPPNEPTSSREPRPTGTNRESSGTSSAEAPPRRSDTKRPVGVVPKVEVPEVEPAPPESETATLPSSDLPEVDERPDPVETSKTSDPSEAEPSMPSMPSMDDEANEKEPPEVSAESSAPGTFRLVGKSSPARSASETSDRRTARDEEPLPDHFPKLELQGTSVIDGAPVAVISDRRVFEGDTIDGARVVRIEERAVTLEFEGRRFTITL